MACFNSYSMNLSPSLLKGALIDAHQCNGIAPTTSQMLIDQGWAEWVDYEFGTPIDENSPRSLMRLTEAGDLQLKALEGTPQTILATPTTPQPIAASQQPSRVSPGLPIRFRAHAVA